MIYLLEEYHWACACCCPYNHIDDQPIKSDVKIPLRRSQRIRRPRTRDDYVYIMRVILT